MASLWSMSVLAWLNLRSQKVLTATLILLTSLVVALVVSIPLFVTSVSGEVFSAGAGGVPEARTLYSHAGGVSGNISVGAVGTVTEALERHVEDDAILPESRVRMMTDSPRFRVAVDGTQVGNGPMSWHEDIEQLVDLVDGRFPADSFNRPQVMLHAVRADELGVVVGDAIELGRSDVGFEAVVTGTWVAKPDTESEWVIASRQLWDRLFVAERTAFGVATFVDQDEFRTVRWMVSGSVSDLQSSQAEALIDEQRQLSSRVNGLQPTIDVESDLVEQLRRFRTDLDALRTQLAVILAPTAVGILGFVLLVVRLRVASRSRETQLWSVRGATRAQVRQLTVLESLLIMLFAVIVGVLGSVPLARLLGSFDGLFDLGTRTAGSIRWTSGATNATVGSAVALLIAMVFAARSTSARPERIALLAGLVAALAAVIWLGVDRSAPSGFDQPAPFVVPMLAAVAAVLLLGLLGTRIARTAARRTMAARSGGSVLGLAARRLDPGSRWFMGPAMLISVGAAVAMSIASVSSTTDNNLDSSVRHRIGADWSLEDAAAVRLPSDVAGDTNRRAPAAPDEFTALPSVDAATRVGSWDGQILVSGVPVAEIRYLTVEPEQFGDVAWWRDDYASAPLERLLDDLVPAVSVDQPLPVLVSESSPVRVGEEMNVSVFTGSGLSDISVSVVGSFALFPSWDPAETEALVVGRLDDFADRLAEDRGFRLWLNTSPDAPEAELRSVTFLTAIDSAEADIAMVRNDPTRRGVYGVLSITTAVLMGLGFVGFLAAIVLSDRARRGESSLLRALGMSASSVAGVSVVEAAAQLVPAALLGGLTGWLLTVSVLPLAVDVDAALPPLRIAVDLGLLVVLGALVVVVLAIGAALLLKSAKAVDVRSFTNEGDR